MPVYHTRSEEETIALGERIGRALAPGTVVLLTGELGAGKTTLVKGIAQGRGAAECDQVSSPTFTLIHEYGWPPLVYHIDFYRLEDARELEALGLDEIFDRGAVAVIEWGERFREFMPPERIEIRLSAGEGDDRSIELPGGILDG